MLKGLLPGGIYTIMANLAVVFTNAEFHSQHILLLKLIHQF